MSKAAENIELRSEKVRNIIGQIPPRLLRTGISAIFLIFAFTLAGTWFFQYDYIIRTSAEFIPQTDSTVLIKVNIPVNQSERIKKGQTVVLLFDIIPHMYGQSMTVALPEYSKIMKIANEGGYFTSTIRKANPIITPQGATLEIRDRIRVNAEINTGKIRFFDRVTESMIPRKSLK
jgi:hypothetical protein